MWDLVLLFNGKVIQEKRDVRMYAADDDGHNRSQTSWQSTEICPKICNYKLLKDRFQQTSQACQKLMQKLHEHSNLSINESSEQDQNTYKVS
jgi:hypothetical protein